ncbi:acidic skeletal organic matrix protein-like [Ostrea edulis]|uniref:acidic skeletal organic matrix protein-like n=1 Tax=Ostrea edulis TaxID=37623 RepID=UPI0024AFF447|nr:acidic skeletal organic matrix protein-like [Ostrea edulis]
MLGKAILLVFLSVSAFNFTQGQTNDTTISAEKVYLKIQGQSGGMVIGRVQNPDQDNNAVKIKFDAIQEVNSAGVAVGASGRSKHSFNNFAQLDFTFSSLEDTTYKNLTAKTVSFKASISSVNANLTVQTFIITEAGNITIDGESTVVEKGTVKFNINIEGWGFCDASGNCRKGNQDEIGEYIDLTISIKGKGTPSKKAGNNKRSEGEEFDLGGDASVALSKKISMDGGSYEDMPGNYPTFRTQGSKQLFVFRFPKFNNSVLYDPIIYTGIADSSSGAAAIQFGFSLLLVVIMGVFTAV